MPHNIDCNTPVLTLVKKYRHMAETIKVRKLNRYTELSLVYFQDAHINQTTVTEDFVDVLHTSKNSRPLAMSHRCFWLVT